MLIRDTPKESLDFPKPIKECGAKVSKGNGLSLARRRPLETFAAHLRMKLT